VAALDPAAIVDLADNPDLEMIAADARARLQRVIGDRVEIMRPRTADEMNGSSWWDGAQSGL
jgi:hypothetical protein